MRTLTAAAQAALNTGSYAEHVRVLVKDAGGTWRDLSVYGGRDWLVDASVGEDVDSPHMVADIRLRREDYELSLAALMEESPLNRGFNPVAEYAPLIEMGREIKIESAIAPIGDAPSDWMLQFHGYIDEVDDASGEVIALACRDLGARLAKAFVEHERVYAYEASSGVVPGARIWQPSTAYSVGQRVLPATPNGHHYICTGAGTTGTIEPQWLTGSGSLTASGTATFQEAGTTSDAGKPVEAVMQAVIDDTLGSGVVLLYTPSSPGWMIRAYLQERVPVLEAIRTLAQQIGWDVRYKWDESTSQFRLTFYEPDRSKSVVDRTFSRQQYLSVDGLRRQVDGIRNVVRVVYSDAGDLDPDGYPKRKTVEVSDSASIAEFGRLFMEIAEDATSNIDSATEATALANAVLSDLARPQAELQVTDLYLPLVELGDLYTFAANGVHFSSDQTLAVVAYRHTFGERQSTTSITLRGKPSGGYWRWREQSTQNQGGGRFFQLFPSGQIPTVAGVAGGVSVRITGEKYEGWDGCEYHLSQQAGFTPSSQTLFASGRQTQAEVHGLKPGETYYVRIVPRAEGAVRGEPSPQVAVEVPYLKARHFDPMLSAEKPPNGDFEGWWDDDSGPPDHWEVHVGDWTSGDVYRMSDSASGAYALGFDNGAGAYEVRSVMFPVNGGVTYTLRAWLLRVGSPELGNTAEFEIFWFDREASDLGSDAVIVQDVSQLSSEWTEVSGAIESPSDARFARIAIRKGVADGYGFGVDAVSLSR